MLTNNYNKLSNNFKSTGCHIHTATQDEFMNITIQKILDESDFVHVENETTDVYIRLNIGKSDVVLFYKFKSNIDTFEIKDVPIYDGEEAWIATSKPNKFCAFGSRYVN